MSLHITHFVQRLVRHHARAVVITFGLLFVVFAAVASQVEIDSTVEGLLDSSDPALAESHGFKREFSDDEIIVAAFDLGRAFTKDDLVRLDQVTAAIEVLPGVARASSLTNIEDVRDNGAGGLDASALVDREALAELDAEGFARIITRIREQPLYRGNLVSEDLSVLAIAVVLEPPVEGQKKDSRKVTGAVVDTAQRLAAGWCPMHITGYPVLELESDTRVKHDVTLLSPLVFGVVLLLIYLVGRRVFALVLLVALAGWTTISAIFVFSLAGLPINIVTSAIPAILLASSGTYGIYLLGLLQELRDEPEPAMRVIALVTGPSTLSALSTGAGFLSLTFMQIDALVELGLGLAVGIVAAYIATLFLLPSLIHLRQFRLPVVDYKPLRHWYLVGVRMARRPVLTLGVFGLSLAATVPGLMRLQIETNPIDYFHESSDPVKAFEFVRDHLGGAAMVRVVIRGKGPDDALDPAASALAADVIRAAKTTPTVDFTLSMIDYYDLIDRALRPDEARRPYPPTRDLTAQYLLLYEMGGDPQAYSHYVNTDRSALSVALRTMSASTNAVLAVADTVMKAVPNPGDYTVTPSGSLYLLAKSSRNIATGLLPGLLSTVAAVWLMFLFSLRSFRLATLACLPSVTPVFFCGAAMGYADIPISLGTAMVGLVAIGLGVDDTAHILSHVRPKMSLATVYRAVGLPVTMTTVCLAAGFMMLTLSDFEVIAVLGFMTALTLVTALTTNIMVLPSLLRMAGYEPGDVQAAHEHEDSTAALGHAAR